MLNGDPKGISGIPVGQPSLEDSLPVSPRGFDTASSEAEPYSGNGKKKLWIDIPSLEGSLPTSAHGLDTAASEVGPCSGNLFMELRLIKTDMIRNIQRLDEVVDALQTLATGKNQTMEATEGRISRSTASPRQSSPRQSSPRLASIRGSLAKTASERRYNDDPVKTDSTPKSKVIADFGIAFKEESDKLKTALSSSKRTIVYQWITQNCDMLIETFMGFVVVVNSITVGMSCDVGSASLWLIVDTIFAVVFLLELVYRFRTNGWIEFFCGKDKEWNIFEFALVVLAWFEVVSAVWTAMGAGANLLVLMRIFRLARILRLLRVLRLEVFNELLLMIKGALGGMRTLMWAAILTFWPLYIVCLILRETVGRYPDSEKYFQSVPMAFFTLFRCVVPGECTDDHGRPIFTRLAEKHSWVFALIYVSLMMFMTFGLFNVIVGIYVENVVDAAKSDEQILRKNRLRDQEFFNRKLLDLICILWDYHVEERRAKVKRREHGMSRLASFSDSVDTILERFEQMKITPDLFQKLLSDQRAKEIFQDLEVSDEDQFNMFEALDVDGSGTLELEELHEGIRKLRGPARRCDMYGNEVLLRRILSILQNERFKSTSDRSTAALMPTHLPERTTVMSRLSEVTSSL